jgi:hypothetical protein
MASHDDDLDRLAPREQSRTRGRDRKAQGPKVVMDNPGLRTIAMVRARRLRERLARQRDR